jgi:glucose-1-phosphate thymidylyltransferase
MKGIILAGGSGTRLYPSTKVISKQLLPIYDKPMIYYPLSVLMLARIREILILSAPEDIGRYKELLGDGSKIGVKFEYQTQIDPNGLAEAFILGEKFIGSDNVCLILGDNIFYGQGLSLLVKNSTLLKSGAILYAYNVSDPKNYGIIEFDINSKIKSIEEKPIKPKSNYAATGIYFYDNKVIEIAKKIKPSKRGELEITSINKEYLKRKALKVQILGRGYAWLDTGTPLGLLEASQFVYTVEKRQGIKIACIEEIAFMNGWISKTDLKNLIKFEKDNDYKKYILNFLK